MSQLDQNAQEIKSLSREMAELARNMAKLAETTARFEEREAASKERMDRIESNQKDQGLKIATLHDAVLLNTKAVERISWVTVVAVGAFISGSMGLMFWLVQRLIESGPK